MSKPDAKKSIVNSAISCRVLLLRPTLDLRPSPDRDVCSEWLARLQTWQRLLETGTRLLEKLDFFLRGYPTEHLVAVRIAPKAINDGLVTKLKTVVIGGRELLEQGLSLNVHET